MAHYNNDLQAQLDAAQEMLNANLLEDAWLVLNRLDSLYPDSPEIVATMGDAALKMADFEYAYEMFDQVIAMEPIWSEAWSARGRCRLEMCEMDTARLDLEHAASLDPTNPEAHYCLAILAEFEDDQIKAFHEFTQAEILDNVHFKAPFRTKSEKDFEKAVIRVIKKLADDIGRFRKKIGYAIADLPDLEFCAETGLSPLIPAFSRDASEMEDELHITFYRKNIERTCTKEENIGNEIETAVIGELLGLERSLTNATPTSFPSSLDDEDLH